MFRPAQSRYQGNGKFGRVKWGFAILRLLRVRTWATRPEAAPIDWDPLRQSWLHFWRKDAIGASIFWFSSKDPLQYRSGFVLPMFLGLDGRLALLPLVPLYGGLLFWFRKAVGR